MKTILKMEMNNPTNHKIIELNSDGKVVYIINGDEKNISIDKKVYEYIIYYLKYIDRIQNSGWDKYTKIDYNGSAYNKGLAFYDIEHMIKENRCLDEIIKNDPINIYKEKIKKEKEEKERLSAAKQKEWKKREESSPQIDEDNLEIGEENKKIDSISFTLQKQHNIELGDTCFCTDFIDIADEVDYPQNMVFLGQIKLSDFTKYDVDNKLPKKGYLYFFQAPIVDGKVYEFGKVVYTENENVVRRKLTCIDEFILQFYGIKSINNIVDCIEDYEDYNYSDEEENSSNYVKEISDINKIFGVYCTYETFDLEYINKVTNNYEVLLQIGDDLYGEGVTTFLIKLEDLKELNFENVIFKYSQT